MTLLTTQNLQQSKINKLKGLRNIKQTGYFIENLTFAVVSLLYHLVVNIFKDIFTKQDSYFRWVLPCAFFTWYGAHDCSNILHVNE